MNYPYMVVILIAILLLVSGCVGTTSNDVIRTDYSCENAPDPLTGLGMNNTLNVICDSACQERGFNFSSSECLSKVLICRCAAK